MAIWFIREKGVTVGPISSTQLRGKVTSGEIRPDTLIRKEETGGWVTAGQVRGLFPDTPETENSEPHAEGISPSPCFSFGDMLGSLEAEVRSPSEPNKQHGLHGDAPGTPARSLSSPPLKELRAEDFPVEMRARPTKRRLLVWAVALSLAIVAVLGVSSLLSRGPAAQFNTPPIKPSARQMSHFLACWEKDFRRVFAEYETAGDTERMSDMLSTPVAGLIDFDIGGYSWDVFSGEVFRVLGDYAAILLDRDGQLTLFTGVPMKGKHAPEEVGGVAERISVMGWFVDHRDYRYTHTATGRVETIPWMQAIDCNELDRALVARHELVCIDLRAALASRNVSVPEKSRMRSFSDWYRKNFESK